MHTRENVNTLTLKNGTDTDDLNIMTEELNKYFGSVYNKNNLNFDMNFNSDDKDLIIISNETLNTAIKKVSKTRSCELDCIPQIFGNI